jgi:hypothetical protein
MIRKQIYAGLTAIALSIVLVLTGCEGPVGPAGATGGTGGGGTQGTAHDLPGLQKYLADGLSTVYLVGEAIVGAGQTLTIGAGQKVIVTTTADLDARAAGTGVGKITVAATGTLTNGGGLKFLSGSEFVAAAGATISAVSGNAIDFAPNVAIRAC